jgi:hypothetical protein
MLEPAAPVIRYEHAAPGDLVHIDIKKLARIVKAGHRITGNPRDETRGAGWEFLYVAVACPERSRRDHSRMAFTAMYPDEKAASSADFLQQAAAFRGEVSARSAQGYPPPPNTQNQQLTCFQIFANNLPEFLLFSCKTHEYKYLR